MLTSFDSAHSPQSESDKVSKAIGDSTTEYGSG